MVRFTLLLFWAWTRKKDQRILPPTLRLCCRGNPVLEECAVSILDYVLIAILLIFSIVGYRKGFVIQTLGIIGFGLAFFLAARFHRALAEMPVLQGISQKSEPAALVVAFVTIFFLVAALTSIATHLIGKKIKHTPVRPGDKWLGTLIGLTKGVLVLGALAIGLKQLGLPKGVLIPAEQQEKTEGIIADSVLVPKLAEACLIAVSLIPEESRDEITRVFREKTKLLLGSTDGDVSKLADASEAAKKKLTAKSGAAEKPTKIEVGETGKEPEASASTGKLLGLGAWHQLVVEESKLNQPVPSAAKVEEKSGAEKTPAPSPEKTPEKTSNE